MKPFPTVFYRWLRWSERYTKTDMVYFTGAGFWLYLGQGINLLISLGSAIAFANLLPPELYGNYKYIISVTGVLSTFTLSGLGTALIRAAAKEQEGSLVRAFSLTLTWSVAMLVLGGIAGLYYLLNNNALLGISFLIGGTLLPLITASSLYRPCLVGKKEFRTATFLGLFQNALPTIAVITTILFTDNVITLISVYFTSQAIVYYFLYRFVVRHYIKNPLVDPELEFLGKHLSVMNIVSTIAIKLDSILIFQFLGGTELAIFSFATAIPDQIRASFKNISTLAMPKLVGKSKQELKEAIHSKTLPITLLLAGATTAYVLAAPYIFSILFSQYMSSVTYSQVYSLTILMSLVMATAYFDAQAAVRERYIMNGVYVVTTIITTAAGIYFFGIWGAIGARLLQRFITMCTARLMISIN